MIILSNITPRYKQRAIVIDIFGKCYIGTKVMTSPMRLDSTHERCFNVNGKILSLYPVAYLAIA